MMIPVAVWAGLNNWNRYKKRRDLKYIIPSISPNLIVLGLFNSCSVANFLAFAW
jgi:hypothetical protein